MAEEKRNKEAIMNRKDSLKKEVGMARTTNKVAANIPPWILRTFLGPVIFLFYKNILMNVIIIPYVWFTYDFFLHFIYRNFQVIVYSISNFFARVFFIFIYFELATQAANDTNTSGDRTAISKEMTALQSIVCSNLFWTAPSAERWEETLVIAALIVSIRITGCCKMGGKHE